MKNFNYSGLDATLLQSLITIYDAGKVSDAANQLNISQSTLSHRLEKARDIIGDPLFVRAGRNIEPTLRLRAIIPIAREVLTKIHLILEPDEISYSEIDDNFTVAATDYERNVFLLDVYRETHKIAPRLKLKFVWQKYDNTQALRNSIFDMAISPVSGSSSSEIYQRALFTEEVVVFYDPNCRKPPITLESYLAARHIRVIFSNYDTSFIDTALQKIGSVRKVALDLPSVSEVASVLRGTDLVVTLPSMLKNSIMTEFEICKPPFSIEPLVYKLLWHDQTHKSKKHQWLRGLIIDHAESLNSLAASKELS